MRAAYARRLRTSALVRNTGWMTLAHALRALAQAGYFVLIARALGVEGLGQLAAALALVFLLVPFAGLGSGSLLVLNVARNPAAFAQSLGYALKATAVSGVVLIVLAVLIGKLVVAGLPFQLLVALAVAELFFGRLCDLSAQSFQAFERLRATALVSLLLPTARLAAAAAFVAVAPARSAAGWAVWHLVASAFCATVALPVVIAVLGRPRGGRQTSRSDLKQGFYFSVGHSSALVYADVDKALLARLAGLEVAGIYAAAYRVASFAFIPVVALLAAAYARFFRYGARGIDASLALARGLSSYSVSYSLLAGVFLYVGAPAVPVILGDGYAASVDVLRWLAPIPVLQSVAYLAGDALTGADRQGIRSLIQVGAAAANLGLNLVLIPAHSWKGAVWATLASLALLAVALWLAATLLARNAERGKAAVGLPEPVRMS